MGILAQRLERRSAADWLNDDDDDWSGQDTPAGVRVSTDTAFSLGAFWRCVDLLTSSVSMSPKDVTLKVGGQSFTEYGKPAWMLAPIPSDPTFTFDDHIGQVALSLLIDGNFFVEAEPYVWDVRSLTVFNPLRVVVRPGPLYDIKDTSGHVVRTLGPMQMLHGKWLPPIPGARRSMNPISKLSHTIGAAIASEEFAGRFFGQGASLSFGVETPMKYDAAKEAEFRASLRKKYVGRQNSHAIAVLWNNSKFVSGLTPTPEQAQMLETRKFAVVETCRPFGVPPVLAGVNDPGSMSYASADVAINTMYQRNAVAPLAVRIENQYRRLLQLPAGITDQSASMQFRLNLDWIVRTDLLSRAQAGKEFVQGGVKTPNEVRALEDLKPLPGGDQLFMQQQMLPIESPLRGGTASGTGAGQ